MFGFDTSQNERAWFFVRHCEGRKARGNPVPSFAARTGVVATTPWIAAGLRPSQ
jgi:hypothetical protein